MIAKRKMQLWYKCAVCNEMVCHEPGPHWLDSGTEMFCPQCGGVTVVMLEKKETAKVPVSDAVK